MLRCIGLHQFEQLQPNPELQHPQLRRLIQAMRYFNPTFGFQIGSYGINSVASNLWPAGVSYLCRRVNIFSLSEKAAG
jgi:hypothetical protein